jgi:hypothetical protein
MPECTRCGVDHDLEGDAIPPLYDVEQARRVVAAQRRKRDELTLATTMIADRLSSHLGRHFAAEELEAAGRSLVIAAASLGALTDCDPATLCNLLAFAGDRMITDGRVPNA